MNHRFVPTPIALKALAEANPGITVSQLAKKIGCNASHLSSELMRAGLELRHGRRSDATTDRRALSVRKITPARTAQLSPCICCGSTFRSEHVGHRMCTDCRREKSED